MSNIAIETLREYVTSMDKANKAYLETSTKNLQEMNKMFSKVFTVEPEPEPEPEESTLSGDVTIKADDFMTLMKCIQDVAEASKQIITALKT